LTTAVYLSKCSQEFFNDNSIRPVPKLSYSSKIVPSNFWLSCHMKIALQERKFEELEQLLDGIHDF
jgi:hypothetical protein